MDAISQRLEREYPQANTGWGATVVPLQELIVGDIRHDAESCCLRRSRSCC